MLDAVTVLAEQTGYIIIYEDPPFVHESELRRDFPGPKGAVPKSGQISYSYTKSETVDKMLQGLIDVHKKQGNAGGSL